MKELIYNQAYVKEEAITEIIERQKFIIIWLKHIKNQIYQKSIILNMKSRVILIRKDSIKYCYRDIVKEYSESWYESSDYFEYDYSD